MNAPGTSFAFIINDPPVYPPATDEEPIASPTTVYVIPSPVWYDSVEELPNTGTGDSIDVGFGGSWVVVIVALVIVGGAVALVRRRNG